MKWLFVLSVVVVVGIQQSIVSAQIRSIHAKNILFKYYDEVGEEYQSKTIQDSVAFERDVRVNEHKVAVITHGWRESCASEWVSKLIRNLHNFRGGTVICMDYSYFSMEESYFRLVRHFSSIAEVLKSGLRDLQHAGYDPEDMYLFGFSFGGQLVVEAGKRFGTKKIKQIDVCDMAGPGFDGKPTTDHRLAAQNVQCIHTSRDKGTKYSLCHQNWKMGNCGKSQDAASSPPLGSHGLCPYFYNSAFHSPFYAIPKPAQCRSKIAASNWPKNFRMGYLEDRKGSVQGELFALTSRNYPFNVEHQTETYQVAISENEIDRRNWNGTEYYEDADFYNASLNAEEYPQQ